MVKIAVLYDPDESCVDPKDEHAQPRRHFDLVEGDAILMWVVPHGDLDGPEGADNHQDIHVVGTGRFENVTIALANEAMGVLTDLPPEEDPDD